MRKLGFYVFMMKMYTEPLSCVGCDYSLDVTVVASARLGGRIDSSCCAG